MLKKTITILALMAILATSLICGVAFTSAEELKGDCVVKYIDLDGNVIATQSYNKGDKITGLDNIDNYTRVVDLPSERYGSKSEWLYFDTMDMNIFNTYFTDENFSQEELLTNICMIRLFGESNGVIFCNNYFNELADINNFKIDYRIGDEAYTFEKDTSALGYNDMIYDSEDEADANILVTLHDSNEMNFVSIVINPDKNITISTVIINDKLRYKDDKAYREYSKSQLPQIYVNEMTFVVPVKNPGVDPGDPDTSVDDDKDGNSELNFFEKLKVDFDNFFLQVKSFFDSIGNWFKNAWTKITDFFTNISNKVKELSAYAKG